MSIHDRRNSECTNKKRFYTRREAKRYYKKLNIPGKDAMNAYQCSFCGLYHLGHLRAGNLLRVSSYNAFYSDKY